MTVICPSCGHEGVLRPLFERNPGDRPTRPNRVAASVLHEENDMRRICLLGRFQLKRLQREPEQLLLKVDRPPRVE